ncbi:MAG: DegT/DnrJ/EryC1/StrS family aminotransferase [Bacteroidales bacterium]|nr:DegT/DnrJ/EryC1/StrS family aminotransferase [Bacteroidales bacterium]
MHILQYTPQMADVWNGFVRASKNGTFLFERGFMDYHSDRFIDCSLLIYEDQELVALFPANWNEAELTVYSHQGLTYGGLVLSTASTQQQVLEIMQNILLWYLDYLQAERLVYKPIPYIYSHCASEEDLYALFRAGARLKTRGVSSVVDMSNPLQMRKLRIRGAKKAIDNDLYIDRMTDEDWPTLQEYWQLLTEVLEKHHSVRPVHSCDEMKLLMTRFPQLIKLFLVRKERTILAGCLVFITSRVAHVQYIAAGEEGRETGALDLLFRHLINERFKQMAYLDFGISTENGGQYFNEGLAFQKEGFGARSVCYDSYELEMNMAVIEQMHPMKERPWQQVSFLDLRRVNGSFEPLLSEAVSRVVHSGWYLQGTEVKNFEKHFANYIGARHCVLCANGLEALTLILRAFKMLNWWDDDSEVIVPANTFIATILAVKEAGLVPVLCEPNDEDCLINVDEAKRLYTAHTVAVLPVHLYGRVCDMTQIKAFASEHHLLVVEDAAQAHGAMWEDQHAGHLGHAAAFSFYPAKNLGALGDAGCITTDDDTLAETVRMMANYGSKEKYVNEISGMNSRTDELQAAVLDVKLPRLDADNARRRWIACRYLEGIDNPLLRLPEMPQDEREHVFYVFAVRTGYRSQLIAWLKEQGVDTLVHYPIPPHRQQALAEFADLSLPVTEQIHREVLSLPISPVMTNQEVEKVIDAVNRFNPIA